MHEKMVILLTLTVVNLISKSSFATPAFVPEHRNSTEISRTPTDFLTDITLGGATVKLCTDQHLCRSLGCYPNNSLSINDSEPPFCHCDDECNFYGDCCYDYASYCGRARAYNTTMGETSEVTPVGKNLKMEDFSCEERPNVNGGILVVSACKSDQEGATISSKCLEEEENITSFYSFSHVTSTASGLTYKNIYCALCNSEPRDELVSWPVDLVCREEADLDKVIAVIQGSDNATTEKLGHFLQSVGCNVSNRFPLADEGAPSVTPPRACFSNVIDSCPVGGELDGACSSYTAIVRRQVTGNYRNPHCCLCNFPTNTNNACMTRCASQKSFTDSGILMMAETRNPPISILMDFRSSTHVKIVKEKTVVFQEQVTCPTGHVFDPFSEKCLRLFCPYGYVLDNYNRCISKTRKRRDNDSPDRDSVNLLLSRNRLRNKNQSCSLGQSETISCISNMLEIERDALSLEEESLQDYCVYTGQASNRTMHWVSAKMLRPSTQTSIPQSCNISSIWILTLENQAKEPTNASCKERVINADEYSIHQQQNSTFISVKEAGVYPLSEVSLSATYHIGSSNISKTTELTICEEVNFTCAVVYLNRSLFREISDDKDSVEHIPSGTVFSKWEYRDTTDNRREVCSFMNTIGNRTSTRTIRFFEFSDTEVLLSLVGNIVSMIAAGFTFLTYFVFDALRTHATCCIMNLVASLFVAQLLHLLIGSATANPAGCTIIAVLEHYFWLVYIFWTAVLAYDLYRTFSNSACCSSNYGVAHRPKVRSYALATWGGTALIVIPCLVIDLCDCTDIPLTYGSSHSCWIDEGQTAAVVFGAPVAVVLLSNVILFTKTVCGIRQTNRDVECAKKHMGKSRLVKEELIIYVKISSLMGFTWIFGFVAAFADVKGLWIIFTILNPFQGLLIFLSFTCKSKVWTLWLEAFCGEAPRQRSYSLGMASSSASATRASRV